MADEARPRPIEDVREISAITYGFMASKALFAALIAMRGTTPGTLALVKHPLGASSHLAR